MKKNLSLLLLIAILGVTFIQCGLIKQNINEQKKNLAQDSDCGCDMHIPTCPVVPPPSNPPTTLTSGVLQTIETGTAAGAILRSDVFANETCIEELCEHENAAGSSNIDVCGCLCHKRKYCLAGSIDYARNHTQTESGICRSVKEAIQCTNTTAASEFVGGAIENHICINSTACPIPLPH